MAFVGGFRICPFHGYREPVFTQQIKTDILSRPIFSVLSAFPHVQQIVAYAYRFAAGGTGYGHKNQEPEHDALPFITSLYVRSHARLLKPQQLTCTRTSIF